MKRIWRREKREAGYEDPIIKFPKFLNLGQHQWKCSDCPYTLRRSTGSIFIQIILNLSCVGRMVWNWKLSCKEHALELKGWWECEGRRQEITNPTTTICEILERSATSKSTNTVIGTVTAFTYHQLLYQACGRLLGADKICFLKVLRVDRVWRCKTCQSRVTWRFFDQVEMADTTGSLWVIVKYHFDL